MGSVAEVVVRRAPCLVLTVKSPLVEADVAEPAQRGARGSQLIRMKLPGKDGTRQRCCAARHSS